MSADDARLDALVQELASGRLPRDITADETADLAARMQTEIDRGVAARDELLAAKGATLACKRGCCGCCEEPIMVHRPEAARVARWLAEPAHADARAAFLAAYPGWRARVGDMLVALSATYANDPGSYRDAHVAAWAKGVPCAFLRDGACTIYEVRPISCRTAHAIDTAEFCSGAATESATRARFVPLDEFVARTRALLAAAHQATQGAVGPVEPLCDVVHVLVASPQLADPL